jgi:hypothetical protein
MKNNNQSLKRIWLKIITEELTMPTVFSSLQLEFKTREAPISGFK